MPAWISSLEAKDMIGILALLISVFNASFNIFQYTKKAPEKNLERARAAVEDLVLELDKTEFLHTEDVVDNWIEEFAKMDLIRNLSASCVPKIKQANAPDEVAQAIEYIYENSKFMRRLFEDYKNYSETLRARAGLPFFPRERVTRWRQLSSAEITLSAVRKDIKQNRQVLFDWMTKR